MDGEPSIINLSNAGRLAKVRFKTEVVSLFRSIMKALETSYTSLVNGPHHSLNLPVADTI